jgi:RNA polymerase sigma-70 factor, ECF subfamily
MKSAPDRTVVLLDRLADGDEEALGALFDSYRPSLRQEIARELTADPRLAARFDASDVVQEVFLDARRQIGWFLPNRAHVNFGVWLRGLARERRLKFLRDHLDAQCRTAKRQRALPDESWQHPAAQEDSPSGAIQTAEQSECIRRALQRLRPEDQDVIRLRITDGRSNPEVAGLLGATPAAVAKRLERALHRLREAVAAETAADAAEGRSHDRSVHRAGTPLR